MTDKSLTASKAISLSAAHLPARLKEGLLLGLMLLCAYGWMLLLSYSPTDPGWSSSGRGGEIMNAGGVLGAVLSDMLFSLFGYFTYLLPLLMLIKVWQLFRQRKQAWQWNGWVFTWRVFGFLLLMLSGTVLAYVHFSSPSSLPQGAGGILGASLGQLALDWLNVQGSTLLGLALVLIGITAYSDLSWFRIMDFTGKVTLDLLELTQSALQRWWDNRQNRKNISAQLRDIDDRVAEVSSSVPSLDEQSKVKQRMLEREQALSSHMTQRETRVAPQIELPKPAAAEPSKRVLKEKQQTLFTDSVEPGSLPPLSLLDPAEKKQKSYSAESLEAMSRLLEIKLKEFGVEASVESVHPGPVITRFEIQPAPGVKVAKIANLAKDLARSMAMISVRVVEVIPGKTTVGIEVPNEDRDIVRFSEVLGSRAFDDSKSPVTLALGHDIAGQPVCADLAKMPHLLVAGTTGSGKSVGVNAMLLSILFKSAPEQVRLIMIDPKMLELSIYEGIPHLLCPVVTDMKEAANSLRWSVAEMERRYKLMAKLGVRNLAGYNRKVREAEEAGEPLLDPLFRAETPDEQAPYLKHLPVIVVVIDEFADMMMIVGKKVEELIARIAQKARAAGIHLILATQRPSVDVITGLIKANIPTRIAFQVSSKIDSRTILDQGGAEQLLGHGDMLYMPPGTSLPIRVHGAFVSDDEVHRVVEAWKERGSPEYIDEILEGVEEGGAAGSFDSTGGNSEGDEADPLYDEAVRFVTESRRASISAVQRKLKIGYNRAARMIESMEAAGVVTSMNTNGSREVLAPPPVRD
ncbi:DNA segregation ATPase FtsK/SpoIIIE, S-DNA-T family [Atopomonas hussainii]|uniref:DNA translocase FtsK n=1 Tax=Atopomonas hussainii TaxID=1429083 RepID=A0A1H7MU04_9GAMM|nr:DNA segregation ATPase FtsK/SpoIIIE, S-DNA-T family [Atopomonas hussainii]